MNWRCFFQLSLLSLLVTGFWPDPAPATKAPATKAPATKAPATAKPSAKPPAKPAVVAPDATAQTPHRPWLIGGGAFAAAGGAIGLYRLGRRSGKELAQADQAVHQYRTLGKLAPALPSCLEAELYGLKSAQPQLADQSSPQEIAAEQAGFTSELHEFDAVQMFDIDQSVDAAQLDAAFAAIADLPDRPAAQPVFPIAAMPPAPPTIIPPPAAPTPATTVRAAAIALITPTAAIGLARQTRLPQVGAVENLLKEIQNPDPVKRRKAIWDLGQWGDTRAVQPLVDLMIEADSKQRSLILSALSEIGTRTIKPMSRALAISLQDDNVDVRKNAIRDLTRIYDLVAQVSQMVQKCALDDPEVEVRETAAWALKQLNRIRPASLDHNLALSGSVSSPESLPAQ